MGTIQFTVRGKPQGKQRARSGRTSSGRPVHYTPEKTRAYEEAIRLAALEARGNVRPHARIPWAVSLDIVCAVPPSWTRKQTSEALLHLVRPTSKPDCDNVLKAVCDACNGVLWADDSQVVDARATKRYGGEPAVHVTAYVPDSGSVETQQRELGL